jgi:hypothetical protein
MITQAAHGLGLAPHPGHVEALGLHERDRDLSIETCIAREVNPLLCALSEEADEAIATPGQSRRRIVRERG